MVNLTLYNLGFALLIIGIIFFIISLFVGKGDNDGENNPDDGDKGKPDDGTGKKEKELLKVVLIIRDDHDQPLEGVTVTLGSGIVLGQTTKKGEVQTQLAPGKYELFFDPPNDNYRKYTRGIIVRATDRNEFLFRLSRNYSLAYDYSANTKPPREPGQIYDLYAVLLDPVTGAIATMETAFLLETTHGTLYEVLPGAPDPLQPSHLGRNLGTKAQLQSEAKRALVRFALVHDHEDDVEVMIQTTNPDDGTKTIPCPYRRGSSSGPGTITLEFLIDGKPVPSLIPGSPAMIRIRTDHPAGFHPQPGDEFYLVDNNGTLFEVINIPAVLQGYLVDPQTYEIPIIIPKAGDFAAPLRLHYHLS